MRNEDDGIQLVGEIYYAGYDALIMYDHQFTPDFWDLKNGLAGAILQKFTNYKIQLAIINFANSLADALELFNN